jgi:arabinogalactan oligomer/maltooligosaccharide transport system permease protein
MLALVAYPLVRAIQYSFTNADQFNSLNVFMPDSYFWVGFENYIQILQSQEFRDVLWFTVIWTISCVFFHYVLGLGLALALNRPVQFRTLYRILLLVPWAMPVFISAFAWRFMFNSPYGFFADLLFTLGVTNPPAFLGDDGWAKFSVILVNVWLGFPFMVVALLGGLQAIDSEQIEAAEVDGANAWQRFVHVTMPGLRPVSATVILLGLIWTFNIFAVIYLITGGGPGTSTQILTTWAYTNAFEYRLYGVGTAYGVIILSILIVFSSFYRRMIRRMGEESW